FLFYSGNDWSSRNYAVGYAVCAGPTRTVHEAVALPGPRHDRDHRRAGRSGVLHRHGRPALDGVPRLHGTERRLSQQPATPSPQGGARSDRRARAQPFGVTGSCSDGPRGTVTSSGSSSTTRSPSRRSVGEPARSHRPPRLGRLSGVAPSDRSMVRMTPPWVTTSTSPEAPSTTAANPARVRARSASSPSKSGGDLRAAR